ncbi:regulatory protein ada [Cylas formicarius]|uniref:regulatory protein ada n=1 Tax=Cylas formicarius TaxID=197179 RepID=UPI0029585FBC|nr:regulatory protein ada [Cylas formicarius]
MADAFNFVDILKKKMNLLERIITSTLILNGEEAKRAKVIYVRRQSAFGNYIAGFHNCEICFLQFYDDDDDECLRQLKQVFPRAEPDENFEPAQRELRAILKGTELDVLVWRELLKIDKGTTVSYESIARAIGRPKAVRAVANAVGRNNISYLVPCHRVIRKNGELGGFGGGVRRKLKMLHYEGVKI